MTTLPDCNGSEFICWLLRRRQRRQIEGDSMLPLLQAGEEVLVDFHAYRRTAPQVGEIVVAEHPQKPNFEIIKRINMVLPDKTYVLYGENLAASSDSRQFGPVARSQILGRITCRFG
ncbi:MAG: nickel-type superoxide dismutase maturation protease [Spirulina sp. SIO3F2]|nr:nickel-type superoxide dismutase maturation protease [Spirulina sp. SIO3F2]